MKTIKQKQQGFTLIELMIVVAIIGILAAVGMPAYQNYTSSAEISACLSTMNGGKGGVDNLFYKDDLGASADADDIGLGAATTCDITLDGDGAANDNATAIILGVTDTLAATNDTVEILLTRNNTTAAWACTVRNGSDDSAITEAALIPEGCTSP